MEKDLIIDVNPANITIALLENHKLVELNIESNTGSISVGDVYLGRVKKIMPALNAAFVDIGDEKEAFIHYLDLGLNYKAFDLFAKHLQKEKDMNSFYSNITVDSILEKEGKIEDVLTVGQPIIVQIVKEPISTKGARLTAEISIAGRNIVLLPFADKVNISQKISSKEEKKRLERLVYSILPKNYGAIIRTAAEGKKAAVLDAELRSLISKWEDSFEAIANGKPPKLLFNERSRTTTILRDLLNDSFTNIVVNDKEVYQEILSYISTIMPDQKDIVKYYKGNTPIFDAYDLTKQIKGSFGKVVPIKQGAYIVIEHTEALNVVDVNSGIRAKTAEQEENSFIVYKHMQELMANDRAKHNVLPLTKFGLMQITRQRVRPATEIKVNEKCPMCHGTGEIAPTILADEALERELAYYVKERHITSFILKLNPVLEAYITKGFFNSIKRKWCKKYKCAIKTESVSDFMLMQSQWCNSKGEVLED